MVSGEHGGNSGKGLARAGVPPGSGVQETWLLPPVSDQCCLQPHPSGRSLLLPPGTQMTLHQWPLLRISKQQGQGTAGVRMEPRGVWRPHRVQRALGQTLQVPGGQEAARGEGRLTGGLGLSGQVSWLLRPGVAWAATLQSLHVPISLSRRHLDDVLLASVGICDGVCCAV